MLITYSIISIVLIFCYLVVIASYIYYWNRLKTWEIPSNFAPTTSITVVIAARNEELNIQKCIQAILAQDYPQDLLEIRFVNDHSEDNTGLIIKSFLSPNLLLIELPPGVQGKKQAITTAIQQSQGELIITTDADCIMSSNWLRYIVSYYEQHQVKFIAAPVSFYAEKSIFERFQTLDFMGMMAVSGAGIEGRFMNLCNGANLAYQRAAFEAVNGFEGNEHLASGDDMLLMQKIAALYPNQLGYIKNPNSQVQTYAKSTLKEFAQQRIRWTSKSSAYTGGTVLFMLATVWLLCLSMLVDVFFIFNNTILYLFCLKFCLKGLADFIFLGMMTHFFNRSKLLFYFIPSLVLHWLYISIIGTLGNLFKQYEWKGRKVN